MDLIDQTVVKRLQNDAAGFSGLKELPLMRHLQDLRNTLSLVHLKNLFFLHEAVEDFSKSISAV